MKVYHLISWLHSLTYHCIWIPVMRLPCKAHPGHGWHQVLGVAVQFFLFLTDADLILVLVFIEDMNILTTWLI